METIEVDPRTLYLPPARQTGADPGKLARQIAAHGDTADGMPPIWCYRAADGGLIIYNGVTRATRMAKLSPGTKVTVEVIGTLRKGVGDLPTVGKALP